MRRARPRPRPLREAQGRREEVARQGRQRRDSGRLRLRVAGGRGAFSQLSRSINPYAPGPPHVKLDHGQRNPRVAGRRPHLRRRRRGGVLRLAAGVSWIRAPPTLTELGQSADRGRGRGPLLLLRLLRRLARVVVHPAGAAATPARSGSGHDRSHSARVDAQLAIRGGRRAALFLPVLRRAADRVPRRGARALREVLRAAPLVQTPRRASGGEALGRRRGAFQTPLRAARRVA